jgi:hypothetical protein
VGLRGNCVCTSTCVIYLTAVCLLNRPAVPVLEPVFMQQFIWWHDLSIDSCLTEVHLVILFYLQEVYPFDLLYC